MGNQFTMRFNTLAKPFDNPKVRQALWYALNQEDFLKAVVGTPEYYKVCKAMFICGTPFATEAGMEDKLTSNFKKAKELLEEAKYDGTPIVLMHSTDLQILTNLAPVAKSLMERAGFKVDMQSMDWQTIVARRAKKDAPSAGGWHAFLTSWVSADLLNPIMTGFLNASCEKACSAGRAMRSSRSCVMTSRARSMRASRRRSRRKSRCGPSSTPPTSISANGTTTARCAINVQGVVPASTPVLWNISKN